MITEYRELVVNNYTLRGFFQYEKGYKKVVVMLHGFTGHKNEHANMFKQFVDLLVPLGYGVLRYDYYGSGDSDGLFSDQTYVTVLADARAALKEGYSILNQKVIILGFSMGGATAARMTAEFPELIEKAVLIAPSGDLGEHVQAIFKNRDLIDGKFVDLGGYYISKAYGDSFEGMDLYKDVERFTGPVVIVQGSADQSVSPASSYIFQKKYPHSKYYIVEGANHGFSSVEFRKLLMKYVGDFLKMEE